MYNYTKFQQKKFKSLERALDRELKQSIEVIYIYNQEARNQDIKAQIELQKMLNKQNDKKRIRNQKKRILLLHQSSQRFYDIQNEIHKKITAKMVPTQQYRYSINLKLSMPDIKRLPVKYRELVETINDNNFDDESIIDKVPSINMDKKTIQDINNTLEASMKRYRNYSKEPLLKIGEKITIKKLNDT